MSAHQDARPESSLLPRDEYSWRECFLRGKPLGGRSAPMMYALIVIFVLVQVNFWLVEYPRHVEDPMRSGFNIGTMTTVIITAYVVVNYVDAALDCNERARTLSFVKRRKLLVHAFEIVWGTIVFVMLSYLLLLTYGLNRPRGCEVNFITLSEYMYPVVATLVEGLPESIDGFPVVNPGTKVLQVSAEDAEKLVRYTNDCLYEHTYWFEIAGAMVWTMYVFELFYLLQNIRVSLMTHHLFVFGVFYAWLAVPQSTLISLLCIIQYYFAALEQPTFVALILYRLSDDKRRQARWLKFGAIWFAIGKLITIVVTVYLMITYKDAVPNVIVPIWVLLLLVGTLAQGYSVYAQWSVATRVSRRVVQGRAARPDEAEVDPKDQFAESEVSTDSGDTDHGSRGMVSIV